MNMDYDITAMNGFQLYNELQNSAAMSASPRKRLIRKNTERIDQD